MTPAQPPSPHRQLIINLFGHTHDLAKASTRAILGRQLTAIYWTDQIQLNKLWDLLETVPAVDQRYRQEILTVALETAVKLRTDSPNHENQRRKLLNEAKAYNFATTALQVPASLLSTTRALFASHLSEHAVDDQWCVNTFRTFASLHLENQIHAGIELGPRTAAHFATHNDPRVRATAVPYATPETLEKLLLDPVDTVRETAVAHLADPEHSAYPAIGFRSVGSSTWYLTANNADQDSPLIPNRWFHVEEQGQEGIAHIHRRGDRWSLVWPPTEVPAYQALFPCEIPPDLPELGSVLVDPALLRTAALLPRYELLIGASIRTLWNAPDGTFMITEGLDATFDPPNDAQPNLSAHEMKDIEAWIRELHAQDIEL